MLHRVKRIIYNNNKTLNAMEKIFLASGITVAGLLTLAFSPGTPQRPVTAAPVSHSVIYKIATLPLRIVKDTVPVLPKETGLTNINTIVDGKRYNLTLKNDVITELQIDREKVLGEKIARYKAVTDAIIKQAKENIAKEKLLSQKALLAAERDKTDAEISKVLAEKMAKTAELSKLDDENSLVLLQKLKEVNAQQPKIKDEQTLALLEQLKGNLKMKEGKELATEALLNSLKAKQSLLDASLSKGLTDKLQSLTLTDAKNELRLTQLESELSLKDASRSLIDAELSKKLSAELKASAELSMKKDKELDLNAKTTSEQIINDLMRENLIKDKKNLSFSLTKDELIVNGAKQADAIFQKFKEKYVKTEDWNFNYNNKE